MAYLSRFFLCTAVIITVACLVNWFVDPFGMYWSPVVEGINRTKPASGDRVRVTKAYRANGVAPQVLLVGNSRAEMGLYPGHHSFENANVYNQAMPGAGIRLQTDYALNTIYTTSSVQKVIMSVDYLDFLVLSSQLDSSPMLLENPEYWFRLPLYTPGATGRIARLREQSALLLSLDGLVASTRTVLQQGAEVNTIGPQGFNEPGSYLDILRVEGIDALFIQKLLELNESLRSRDLVTIDANSGRSAPQFTILADFLADLVASDIKVQLFISPYHISYLHILNTLGLTEDFLSWKRELLNVVQSNGDSFELWDFSGPSIAIQESVPVGSNQAMKWFWEPAHYRRELGDRILETLKKGEITSDFGVRLTEEIIDDIAVSHRTLLDSSHDQWLALQRSLGIRIGPASNSQ